MVSSHICYIVFLMCSDCAGIMVILPLYPIFPTCMERAFVVTFMKTPAVAEMLESCYLE